VSTRIAITNKLFTSSERKINIYMSILDTFINIVFAQLPRTEIWTAVQKRNQIFRSCVPLYATSRTKWI